MIMVTLITQWWWLGGINLLLMGYAWYFMNQSAARKVVMFTYMNNMGTMLLGGLWHGASYNFIIWGFLHGLYLIIQRLAGPSFGKILKGLDCPPAIRSLVNMALVYFFTCFAWIFFRATDFAGALAMIEGIARLENFSLSSIVNKFWLVDGLMVIAILLAIETANFKWNFGQLIIRKPVFRIVSYATVLMIIAFFGTFGSNAFIYFVF